MNRTVSAVAVVLIVLMVIVVLLAVVDLVWSIIGHTLSAPAFRLNVGEVLDLFGYVLLVMIGIELIETIRAFLVSRYFHVEVVLLVATIAVARKIIVLKIEDTAALVLVGLGVLILGLSGAYFLIRRSMSESAY